jgi:hypothetical protein
LFGRADRAEDRLLVEGAVGAVERISSANATPTTPTPTTIAVRINRWGSGLT